MFSKTVVIFLILVTTASAASTVDIRLGLAQIYALPYGGWDWGDYDESNNKRAYVSDIGYEIAFNDWSANFDLRTLILPGEENSVAVIADLQGRFYFSKAPVRVYVAPGLGYNHTEKRMPTWVGPAGRSKRDYFRFPVTFGVKAVSGNKYLDICYRIAPEVPMGDLGDHYFDEARDFYLEQAIEGEFGWAFSKHFGMTGKAGAVKGNYATTINSGEDASAYVPFVEIGPSIYF